jgi:hypothetical protein
MTVHEAETNIVGPHRYEFIPPNRCVFTFVGAMDEEHAATYLAFLYKHADAVGGQLEGVYDISRMNRMTFGARSRIVSVSRPFPLTAIAIVGTNFSIRTLADMIIKAGKIVAPKHFTFAHKFVATFDEANAWLDEVRKQGD